MPLAVQNRYPYGKGSALQGDNNPIANRERRNLPMYFKKSSFTRWL